MKNSSLTLKIPNYNHIIERFNKFFDIPRDEIKFLLNDCVEHMRVSYMYKKECGDSIPILSGQEIIDEMWHNFILFTKEYTSFCCESFGHYIHHEPIIFNKALDPSSQEKIIEKYIIYITKNIGEYFAERWFIKIPRKYTRSYISKIRKLY